ncbi:adenylate cyclase activating polypeptide 1a (pituitary) receptor type I isoform X1, partial [Tachysurus ichikawai]
PVHSLISNCVIKREQERCMERIALHDPTQDQEFAESVTVTGKRKPAGPLALPEQEKDEVRERGKGEKNSESSCSVNTLEDAPDESDRLEQKIIDSERYIGSLVQH